jgi:hypothetical protein
MKNPIAKELRTRKYRKKVIPNKKKEEEKKRNKTYEED